MTAVLSAFAPSALSPAALLPLLAQDDGAVAGIVGGGLCFVLAIVIGLLSLAAIVWAVIDIVKNPALDTTMKVVWILVVLVLELIGVAIYYFVGRNKTV